MVRAAAKRSGGRAAERLPLAAGVVSQSKRAALKRKSGKRLKRFVQPDRDTGQAEGGGGRKAELEKADTLEEFATTGRTGRRNAVPDISQDKLSVVSPSALQQDMAKLSFTQGEETKPKASTSDSVDPKKSS